MENKKSNFDFVIFTILGIIILLGIYLIAKNLGIQVPEINENISLSLILIVGLLTGFHCVGMCGGFVASYTTKNAMNGHKNFKQHLVYGTSKLASYTIIGAIFGLIGSLFVFSNTLKSAIAILAGIFMIFFALSMLGLNFFRKFQFNPKFLTRISMKQYKGYYKGPLTTGLLNGLMIACGPLQAMYLYAAATGSITKGALSLFVFGLGTLPVMLGFGSVATLISKNATKKILKASAVIVLILGLIMLNRGLILSGSNYNFDTIKSNIFSSNDNSNSVILNGDIQEINMKVTSSGYSPNSFVLKTGVKTKWNIDVQELTSCNKEIIVPAYNLDIKLKQGLNTIEFTPNKEGTITWSCWMGMLQGQFIITNNPQNTPPSTVKTPPQHTCGGSSGGGCGCGG
ncbi:MAG: sulfite exporter TauE/SafE family protein [Candidatus Woesearchaeota archaeon]